MIRNLTTKIFFLIFFGCLVLGPPVFAQESGGLKLSITPPLFKVNMNPGETWSSTVKLVNNNTYAVTIYAEVLDFKSGANGGVEFIKDSAGGTNKSALSGWVEINREPIIIEPQQSAELPFFIKLPADAGPGGHYAAILAGSKPPTEQTSGSAIKISSMLASLLLVRVNGQVVEQGEIREFSVDKSLSGDLSAKLKVSFANTGNTHLQPQGEIKITNWWGETRAVFPINQKSNFGNVLPDSEKQWEFEWHGSSTIMDAGRLRADLVIGFGEEATQTDARTIYFWAFDFKPTAITLGIIILILLIIVLLIRRYINKSLRQVSEQAQALRQKEKTLAGAQNTGRSPAATAGAGVINLRSGAVPDQSGSAPEQLTWSLFKRVTIFILILASAAMIAFAFYYFGGFKRTGTEPISSSVENQEAETAKEPAAVEPGLASSTADGAVTITDTAPVDQIASSSTTSPAVDAAPATTTAEQKNIKVKIENGGGVRGAAAKAAELIKGAGLEIASLSNADNFDYQTTQIRYLTASRTQAEAVKALLGGTAALVEDTKITEDLVVVLGKDFK